MRSGVAELSRLRRMGAKAVKHAPLEKEVRDEPQHGWDQEPRLLHLCWERAAPNSGPDRRAGRQRHASRRCGEKTLNSPGAHLLHPSLQVFVSLAKLNAGCAKTVAVERRRVRPDGAAFLSTKNIHAIIRQVEAHGRSLPAHDGLHTSAHSRHIEQGTFHMPVPGQPPPPRKGLQLQAPSAWTAGTPHSLARAGADPLAGVAPGRATAWCLRATGRRLPTRCPATWCWCCAPSPTPSSGGQVGGGRGRLPDRVAFTQQRNFPGQAGCLAKSCFGAPRLLAHSWLPQHLCVGSPHRLLQGPRIWRCLRGRCPAASCCSQWRWPA
jgi:hypothetical protein